MSPVYYTMNMCRCSDGVLISATGAGTKVVRAYLVQQRICAKGGPGDAILLLHSSTRQVDVFRRVPDIIPS